jgi:hypothetical protein
MQSSDDVFQETCARHRAVEPSSGSNVIPRQARPGLSGLRPHSARQSRRFGCDGVDELLLRTKEVLHPQPVIPRTCATHHTRPPALPRMGHAAQLRRSGWTMHARLYEALDQDEPASG